MSGNSKAIDSINKIIAKKKFTHEELAALLGVDRVQIGRYLSGRMSPNSGACLVLAGLSDDGESRRFWHDLSKLKSESLELVTKGIEGSVSGEVIDSDERELLALWRNPKGKVESSLKDLIAHTLGERRSKKES